MPIIIIIIYAEGSPEPMQRLCDNVVTSVAVMEPQNPLSPSSVSLSVSQRNMFSSFAVGSLPLVSHWFDWSPTS